jgi:hypothetical protein
MNRRPEELAEWFFWEMPGAMIMLPASQHSGLMGGGSARFSIKFQNSRPNPRAGQWGRYSDLQNRAALSQVPHYRSTLPETRSAQLGGKSAG